MSNILFIDDDPDSLSINKKYFTKLGFSVFLCSNPMEVHSFLDKNSADCIILDILMPNINGFELCRQIKSRSNIPIIFLSGCCKEEEKINGLMIGADDYLVKPYSFKELSARIQVQLRKQKGDEGSYFECSPFKLSLENRKIWHKHEELILSNQEFDFLKLFLMNGNKIVTFKEIALAIWGTNGDSDRKTIMVIVSRLRKKLEKYDSFCNRFESIRGQGYQLHTK